LKPVLVAGELNPDLILQGYSEFPTPGKEVLVRDFEMVLGSASAIMAMGLARLGTSVAFVARVGDDPWGRFCLETMSGRGIDVSRVVRDPAVKTGLTVAVTSPRDRALVTFLGAIGALTAADLPDGMLAGFRHLHISSFFLQEGLRPGVRDVFTRARRLGLSTSLDPGYDPAGRWGDDLRETLLETDIFLPNEVELRGLGGSDDVEECLMRLQNGRTLIVAKLGADGASTITDGNRLSVPAYPVATVDTTGAGDSFNAGFLHGWLRGQAVADCLRLGAACGALSTLGLGGTARQPDAAEAESLVRAHLS
jgi:sugar/nucleoside kinase (ribokinase family)